MLGIVWGMAAAVGCDQAPTDSNTAAASTSDVKVQKYQIGGKLYTVEFAPQGDDWAPVPSADQQAVERIYNENPSAGIALDVSDPNLRHICLTTEECDRLAFAGGKTRSASGSGVSAGVETASQALTITSPYATLYMDINFGGASVYVDVNISNLAWYRCSLNGSCDNQTSSILGGTLCGVRIYRHPDFGGQSYQVNAGGNVPDLRKKYFSWPFSWNDEASSALMICPS